MSLRQKSRLGILGLVALGATATLAHASTGSVKATAASLKIVGESHVVKVGDDVGPNPYNATGGYNNVPVKKADVALLAQPIGIKIEPSTLADVDGPNPYNATGGYNNVPVGRGDTSLLPQPQID